MNVHLYKKWLQEKLEEANTFPDDADVMLLSDDGDPIMDGLGGYMTAADFMSVEYDARAYTVYLEVCTDY